MNEAGVTLSIFDGRSTVTNPKNVPNWELANRSVPSLFIRQLELGIQIVFTSEISGKKYGQCKFKCSQ
jgi:hypothetical protein